MTEVTVIDSGCDDIAGFIASGLGQYEGESGDVLIRSVHSLNEIQKKKTDILVLTEDAIRSLQREKNAGKHVCIRCGILLLPGDAGAAGEDSFDTDIFDAGCIVSYGMSPKNSITLSSISEESCVLALQRELVTAKGDVLERQEIKINGGLRPDRLLAVAGALLILGQKLAEINR